MQNILEFYNSVKNSALGAEYRKNIWNYFNDKYYKNPYNPEKVDYIYDIFNEYEIHRFDIFQRKLIIPGIFYTFRYKPEIIKSKKNEIYDEFPCVFVLKIETGVNIKIHGINFNFMPEEFRCYMLDAYHTLFKNTLDKIGYSDFTELLRASKLTRPFLNEWENVSGYFIEKYKIPISLCYRTYIYDEEHIFNPIEIDLDDWNYIPFCIPKGIKNGDYKKIISDFYKHTKK